MKIIRSIKKMSDICAGIKAGRKTIGFVPTMGALHEGHASLIRRARRENKIVVASIFVNPAQFGPKEDFKIYPRNLKRDASLCKCEGVDFIFYPKASQMYPAGCKTYVEVEGLSDCLCGKSRPGHFRGVATVVAKLFNIVQPDAAYFGQKDAQQAVVIKRMTNDLNIPVKIEVMPTVREASGLAMSSRNAYLNKKEKAQAQILSKALNLAKLMIAGGAKDAAQIMKRMRELIQKKSSVKIDYIEIVDSGSLKPVKKVSGGCLIALAVYIGKTRLIDNTVVIASPGTPPYRKGGCALFVQGAKPPHRHPE